jgi:hypothetical protein
MDSPASLVGLLAGIFLGIPAFIGLIILIRHFLVHKPEEKRIQQKESNEKATFQSTLYKYNHQQLRDLMFTYDYDTWQRTLVQEEMRKRIDRKSNSNGQVVVNDKK